jgi:hypothetical protein
MPAICVAGSKPFVAASLEPEIRRLGIMETDGLRLSWCFVFHLGSETVTTIGSCWWQRHQHLRQRGEQLIDFQKNDKNEIEL